MDVGLIGLGRMGAGMAGRLHAAGHRVVAFNRTVEKAQQLEQDGVVTAVSSVAELAGQLATPRVVFVMLPAGEVTERMLLSPEGLFMALTAGDIVIEGGNSHYRDSVRRHKLAQDRGIFYIDQGTSGGLAGAERGYCLMLGGEAEAIERAMPLFEALAMPGGYTHVGPAGAGHFAKMVHNAIEYGMMESIAEGLDLVRHGPYPDIDLAGLADTWQHGSIIQSFLVEVLAAELHGDAQLGQVEARVSDSGEGRWALQEAMERSVPFDAIAAALFARYRSRQEENFAGKLLSAMRLGFGGHKS